MSSLVGRRVCSSTHTADTNAGKTYHIANTIVSLRMNQRGSKNVGEIRNEILMYKNCAFRWFVLYNYGMSQCAVQKT